MVLKVGAILLTEPRLIQQVVIRQTRQLTQISLGRSIIKSAKAARTRLRITQTLLRLEVITQLILLRIKPLDQTPRTVHKLMVPLILPRILQAITQAVIVQHSHLIRPIRLVEIIRQMERILQVMLLRMVRRAMLQLMVLRMVRLLTRQMVQLLIRQMAR
jgi:hypothetical protein